MTHLTETRPAAYDDRTWRADDGDAAHSVDLLIEVPHGATRRLDFDRVHEQLTGPMPDDLADFFFVNTDVGAPEAAELLAELLTCESDDGPALASVRVLRGRVPRTFADVNRVLDAHDSLHEEGWNPAVPNYIRGSADRELLSSLHREYDGAAHAAHDKICGNGGFSVILHSYAPRSVSVSVDEDIVAALRRAYEPGAYARCPERPAIEVISEMPDGRALADLHLIEDTKRRYATRGIELAMNSTYRLHPATTGTQHVLRWATRILCVELNRAHLVPEFIPFVELEPDRDAIADLVAPLAESLRHFLRNG